PRPPSSGGRAAQVVRGRAGASPDRQGLAEGVGGQADPCRAPEAVSGGAAPAVGGRGLAGGRGERLYLCVINMGAAQLAVGQGRAGKRMGHTVRRDKLRKDKVWLARYTPPAYVGERNPYWR